MLGVAISYPIFMSKLTYPVTIANGDLSLTQAYPERISQAILEAVSTETEERVMRATYGRSVRPFDSYSVPDTLRSIRATIEAGLEGYAGVTFKLAGSPSDDGLLDVTIVWKAPEVDPVELNVTVG